MSRTCETITHDANCFQAVCVQELCRIQSQMRQFGAPQLNEPAQEQIERIAKLTRSGFQ